MLLDAAGSGDTVVGSQTWASGKKQFFHLILHSRFLRGFSFYINFDIMYCFLFYKLGKMTKAHKTNNAFNDPIFLLLFLLKKN